MTESGPDSVLVVDDDDGYRELLALALQDHCGVANVECFADAELAVRALCEREAAARPQLLLLDLHMPRLGGLGAVRALRAAGVRVPAAIISNAATPEEQQNCLAEGAVAFLHKPALFEQLVATLARLLGRPPRRREPA